MRVEKNAIPLDKMAEQEYAEAVTAQTKSVQDYNIMMGNLEDPSEGEEDEDD